MASICMDHKDYNDAFKKIALSEDRIFHIADYTYMDVNHKDKDVIDFIASTIIEIYESRMLRQILTHDFYYEEEAEIKAILKYARFISNQEEYTNENENQSEAYKSKIALIKVKLEEYFAESTILNLEGFFLFRLKELWRKNEELIENAIDEYMLEKEYKEYIGQLQVIVSEREKRISLIHLVHLQNEQFLLYDQFGKHLQEETLPPHSTLYHSSDQKSDDLIVSRLVTLNPGRIILHTQAESHPVTTTLHSIYENRMELCLGCKLCKTESKLKDSGY